VLDTIPVQFETSVEQSRETKEERIKAIVDTYRDNPKAKPVEIYRQLNIPRPTFYAYQNELIEDGIIEKNGTGVKVIQ
jgi:Mn-dependent DtxR family transcriptional regulator